MLDRVNRVVHVLVLTPLLFLMMPPALFVSGSSASDLGFLQPFSSDPPLFHHPISTLFREKKVVWPLIKIDWNYLARFLIQPR